MPPTSSRSPARLGLAGASITAPFKVRPDGGGRRARAARAPGRRDQHARRARRHGGTAANTDVYGFAAPLLARLRDLPAEAGSYAALSGSRGFRLQPEGSCAPRFSAPAARRAPSPSRSPIWARRSPSARGGPKRRGRSPLSPAAPAAELPPPAGSWDVLVNSHHGWDGDAATHSPIARGGARRPPRLRPPLRARR